MINQLRECSHVKFKYMKLNLTQGIASCAFVDIWDVCLANISTRSSGVLWGGMAGTVGASPLGKLRKLELRKL